jgi:thiol-disulfide isomerase/thioredoxin
MRTSFESPGIPPVQSGQRNHPKRTCPAVRFALLTAVTLFTTQAVRAQTFQSLATEFNEKIEVAKSRDEEKVLVKDYSAKFLSFAEKNPKSPEVIPCLVTVVRMGQEATRAADLLIRDHISNPDMKPLVRQFADQIDPNGTRLLLALIEKNPDRKIQAQACKALVKSREQVVALAAAISGDADVRKETEEALGKEKVQAILSGREKFEKERKEYADLLKTKFPEVRVVDLSMGKEAPELVSQDLAGKPVKLSDLRGKVVVLDFWATWCPPCKAMIPHERELVKKMQGKPFTLVSISADDKKETLTEFLTKEPMPWTHWYNGPEGVVEDWDMEYFPTIYVIDAKGVLRYKDVTDKDLEEAVEKLVKEAEAEKK